MKPTITIEIPADGEALVRRLLAPHEELALAAPDGAAFDAWEAATAAQGRDLSAQVLAGAVARRVQAAE